MNALRKKQILLFLLSLVAIISVGLGWAYADMEDLTLNQAPEGTAFQRPEVPFPHEVHMGEYECLDCHHEYEADSKENILDEDTLEEGNAEILCSACHNETSKMDRQTAFHRQCIACHISVRKDGDDSGPEMCGSCHPR